MSAPPNCRDIAARYKLHRSRDGWRGDCPSCGYPAAFVMNEGSGGRLLLFCASCQDSVAIARAIGQEPRPRDPVENTRDEAAHAFKSARALALFAGAEPARGTPAQRYLMARHIGHLADCPDLRFRAETPHPAGSKLPAMLALVRDAAGQPLAIHRTYLAFDGARKAEVEPAKASLGPVGGGAIRLAPMAAEMAIGEGIETSAAAGLLTGLGAWAAISAGNLARGMILPVGVRAVVIAVDRDPPGEHAAHAAAARWRAEGRHVRLLTPDLRGQDAADVLAARRAGQEAMRAGFYDAERARMTGEVPHA